MKIKNYKSFLLEALTALELEPIDDKKAELFKFAYDELDNTTKSFMKRFCLSIKDKEKLGRFLVEVLENTKTTSIG